MNSQSTAFLDQNDAKVSRRFLAPSLRQFQPKLRETVILDIVSSRTQHRFVGPRLVEKPAGAIGYHHVAERNASGLDGGIDIYSAAGSGQVKVSRQAGFGTPIHRPEQNAALRAARIRPPEANPPAIGAHRSREALEPSGVIL